MGASRIAVFGKSAACMRTEADRCRARSSKKRNAELELYKAFIQSHNLEDCLENFERSKICDCTIKQTQDNHDGFAEKTWSVIDDSSDGENQRKIISAQKNEVIGYDKGTTHHDGDKNGDSDPSVPKYHNRQSLDSLKMIEEGGRLHLCSRVPGERCIQQTIKLIPNGDLAPEDRYIELVDVFLKDLTGQYKSVLAITALDSQGGHSVIHIDTAKELGFKPSKFPIFSMRVLSGFTFHIVGTIAIPVYFRTSGCFVYVEADVFSNKAPENWRLLLSQKVCKRAGLLVKGQVLGRRGPDADDNDDWGSDYVSKPFLPMRCDSRDS